jgi:hypothetical protein
MKRSLVLMLAVLLCGHPALAQNSAEPEEQGARTASAATTEDEKVYVLDEVEVQEQTKELGKSSVKGMQLDMMPSVTGSVTEALKGMSNVQFGYDQDSALTIGEIAPPRVSIAGAKPYENNFMIDGMSITNTLNPSGFEDSSSFGDLMVGGGDQTIFYDTNLLGAITLYSSNVPAEYGHFAGGVVDAELRDPLRDRWHFTVEGRYTQDAWFNMRDVDSDSQDSDDQPEFTIYNANFSAEGPITKHAGLLLSVSRRQSFIPLEREEPDGSLHKDEQERINENYFARLVLNPSRKLKLTLDATYAPYEEKRWREVWPDSEWKKENESWRFVGQAEYATHLGLFTAKVAYAQNGYSRDTAINYNYSLLDLGDRSNDDNFGGGGDAEKRNKQVDALAKFESKEFSRGDYRWKFATGMEFGYKHTDAWNEAVTADVMILYRPGFSIESYHTHAEYDEISQSNHIATYGFFAQTDLTWKRLTLSPGFRVDYDDFTDNTDVAPRLKAEFDTFGNGALRVIAGANRYYGSQLRAYAFDRFRPFHTTYERIYADGSVQTWSRDGDDREYSASGLDTPYSDEVMAGLAGNLFGFDYGVEFVHRDHKDKVVSETEDGENFYLTNNGESTFNGVTISLAKSLHTRRWGNHTFTLSATKSKTKTFRGSYDAYADNLYDRYGHTYHPDHVYYNGEYITRSDMPASNFNAPLVIAFTASSSLFEDRLRIDAVTRWRDSARGLKADARYSDDTPYGTTSGSNRSRSSEWLNEDGEYCNAYKKATINGGVVTDLTIEFDALRKNRYTLTLIAEVVNLFNSSMETSTSETGASSRGRGFYAGLRATF